MQTGKNMEFILLLLKMFDVHRHFLPVWTFFVKMFRELFLSVTCGNSLLLIPAISWLFPCKASPIFLSVSVFCFTSHCSVPCREVKKIKPSFLPPWYPYLPVPQEGKLHRTTPEEWGVKKWQWAVCCLVLTPTLPLSLLGTPGRSWGSYCKLC